MRVICRLLQQLGSAEAHHANEELDAALALLLVQKEEAWKTAVETMLKLLGNVLKDGSNDKFRRIRVSNPAFQSK